MVMGINDDDGLTLLYLDLFGLFYPPPPLPPDIGYDI